MSSDAITVAHLGKRYTIGSRPAVESLRERITDVFTSPFRNWRTLGGSAGEEFWALQDVTFAVGVGEVIGIVGANGAGKSTLLKILSRITPPTTGFVELDGRVASLLEVGTGFHPELTGRENVFLNGAILGMYQSEIKRKFDAIVAFAELEQFIDTPVKRYSSGMFVRLAFSVAAHLDPEILIIDEVLSVGDLHFRNRCLGRMHDLRSEGRTVLFVSHDMTSVRQLCTRALMLEHGRVIAEGDPDDITRRYERANRNDVEGDAGCALRRSPPSTYHLTKVELRTVSGAISGVYDAGDVMDIHLWSSGRAPENSFTIEFKLLDRDGEVISFGAANPVRDTYYSADQQHFVCRLGPLPLTAGAYAFSFTARVWNTNRWDFWDKAVSFEIARCDLFKSGHSISNTQDGYFVIPQEWSAGN